MIENKLIKLRNEAKNSAIGIPAERIKDVLINVSRSGEFCVWYRPLFYKAPNFVLTNSVSKAAEVIRKAIEINKEREKMKGGKNGFLDN